MGVSWPERLVDQLGAGLAVIDEEGRYLYVNAAFTRLGVLPDGAGLERRVPGPEGNHDMVLREVIEIVRTGMPLRGARFERDGRSWEISYVALDVSGRPALAVTTRDATERETALREAKASASRHAALADFSRAAVLTEDLDVLFDEAVALLARELEVEVAGVLELLPGGVGLLLRATVGTRRMRESNVIFPVGAASQGGYTLSVDGPVVVEDLPAETRFSPPALLLDLGIRSGVSVPIRAGSVSWGVLSVHTARLRRFAAPEVYVLRTIANVLGAAIARQAAHTELRLLALQRRRLAREALESGERERQRLADVLHDEVLQHLLFARQECAALAGTESEPAVTRLRQSLDDATRLLRDAVSEIHPVTLAHVGLGPTIQTLAQEYAERGGFDVTVRVTENGPTPHDQLVVTAVRELLNNAVKHAGAATVQVNVSAAETELVVEVSDDGGGFDHEALCDAVAGGHIGLASLVERVEALGGRAELRASAGGRGASVRLALPVP
ncbi:MAG: PAS domain-containing protein [Solirubrobacteraceae bacterium]|nr:PAS domain-containing protein [Solirubrobacteraceae bacterium]